MVYFLLCLLLPPACLLYIENKKLLKIVTILIWILSYVLFLYYSVLIGIVLHFCISISLVVLGFRAKRAFYFSGKASVIYSGLIGAVLLLVITDISLTHSEYNIAQQKGGDTFSADQAALGRALYGQKCSVCHVITDENYVGPSLKGIFNREAGTYEGYNYSEALANADFVWDKQNLRLFLENQSALVPGTRMIISPLEEDEIQLLVQYMETLN